MEDCDKNKSAFYKYLVKIKISLVFLPYNSLLNCSILIKMGVLSLFTGTMPPKKGKSPLSFNSLLRQTLHLSSRKSTGQSSEGAPEVDSRDPPINPPPINSFIPDAAVYDVDAACVRSTFPEHQPELHGEQRESAGERESDDDQDLDDEPELDDERETDGEPEQEVHEEEQPATTHSTPGTGKLMLS